MDDMCFKHQSFLYVLPLLVSLSPTWGVFYFLRVCVPALFVYYNERLMKISFTGAVLSWFEPS